MQQTSQISPADSPEWTADIPLAELKRVVERSCADPAYKERLLADPREAAREYGFSWDPQEIRPLWDAEYRSDGPNSAAVEAYCTHVRSKYKLRDLMRNGSLAHEAHYQTWRERQKARVLLELGPARADTIVHAPMCFELNKGCSVGCWFCGISAPKLSDIWPYTPENATLWRQVLTTMGDIVGPLARWGFCYWATDPLDNPDYEKFCSDYHEILGIFPQTTTALSLRDPARVRGLLKLSESKGCELNRFSILTLKNYLAVHAEYSPAELLHVECIPQNSESPLKMARAGKAEEKAERTDRNGNRVVSEHSGTIACVSGFLFNMVEGSVQLITPCLSSPTWPLGYWVLGRANFSTAGELATGIKAMLAELKTSVLQLPKVKLARFLDPQCVDEGVDLVSTSATMRLRSPMGPAYLHFLCGLLQEGQHSAEEMALLCFYTQGVVCEQTSALLERLFEQGALDEDPAA